MTDEQQTPQTDTARLMNAAAAAKDKVTTSRYLIADDKFPRLGYLAMWTIRRTWIEKAKADAVVEETAFNKLPEISEWSAFQRALHDIECKCSLANLPAFDKVSIHIPGTVGEASCFAAKLPRAVNQGDIRNVEYNWKIYPGTQAVLVRTVHVVETTEDPVDDGEKEHARKIVNGEPLHTKLFRVRFKAGRYTAKDTSKHVPRSFFVETLSEAGSQFAADLNLTIQERFEEHEKHYTDDDLRVWWHQRLEELSGAGMKNGVHFIPDQWTRSLHTLQGVMAEFNKYRTSEGSNPTEIELIEVQDSKEKRAWVARSVQQEVADKLKTLLLDTNAALTRASKITDPAKQSDARADAIERLKEQAGVIQAFSSKYETLLEAVIEKSISNATNPPAEPLFTDDDADRFSLIADEIKKTGLVSDLKTAVGEENVPEALNAIERIGKQTAAQIPAVTESDIAARID